MKLDGESTNTVPEQIEYQNIEVDCGDNATGTWDINAWGLLVTNINNTKVKCSINFIRKDYTEEVLNGTDPQLKENLIPVIIADNGTVTKANIKEEWYNYTNKVWANAVILEDETVTYKDGEIIPEENIESYFVWIPRYKYKIWDEGKYENLTTIDTNKVHTIQVEFETKEVEVSTGSTTNSWLTHPAFTSFDVNGLWVGKFESGYKGATNTGAAQKNTNEPEKLQIKPNVYSWRLIHVANMHLNSYNYKRELDSHMMKNTEWGAVAYLQHSAYGSQSSVRINNNYSYITGYAAKNEPTVGYTNSNTDNNMFENTSLKVNGNHTFMYNTSIGYKASTTGNISGIYDMSGGAWEYMMGIISDENGNPMSGRSKTFNSSFKGTYGCPTCDNSDGTVSNTEGIDWPDAKYYDLYVYGTSDRNYKNRILGDATGEMGPFQSTKYDTQTRYINSWYDDEGWFVYYYYPWFARGGNIRHGNGSGIFTIFSFYGHAASDYTFRVVLAP